MFQVTHLQQQEEEKRNTTHTLEQNFNLKTEKAMKRSKQHKYS